MSDNKPHICFVAPFVYPVLFDSPGVLFGGAEVQQVFIGEELARSGYQVTIITHDFNQPASCQAKGMNILKFNRPGQGIPFLRFLHPNVSSLWQAMKKADADIYYQRTAAYLTGIVSMFTWYYKRKFIYAGASNTDFIVGDELLRNNRDKKLFRLGLKRANAVIVQNEAQQRLCRQNYRIDPYLIPNTYPVPVDKPQTRNQDNCLLWVGAIRQFKGPELFLWLAKSMPEFRFVMIGGADDSSWNYYNRIKAEASKISNLDFYGFMPFSDTEQIFDDAAVFLNTSEKEGFPNTFLQAWARGIPTISFFSPFDGTKNKPGCYVSSLEEFKQKISDLMSSPATRKSAGESCRSYYLKHLTPAAVIPKYEEVFSQLDCSR